MIAGKTGIDHIMNWVYVSEDSSTHDFLKGGELIITTGSTVRMNLLFMSLLKR